jgi:hypothetical protein
MTQDELQHLKRGDVVRHVQTDRTYVVTGNYGTHVTAVESVDITNPVEWTQGVPR